MGAAMYSSFPKRDRVLIRIALCFAWASVSLGGFGGVLRPPLGIEAEIGHILPFLSSLVIAVFGMLAAIGVAVDRYWLEWMAAWFVAGGVFAFTAVIWFLVFASGVSLQSAALLTGLLGFFVYRIFACSAHARKQRQIHNLVHTDSTELPSG